MSTDERTLMVGRTALVVLLCMLMVGCGNDPAPASAPTEGAVAPDAPPSDIKQPGSAPVRPLPARGEATVRYSNGVVSVDALMAPRGPLLDRLANAAEFTLVVGESDWPPLTLRIDDMPLELALPLLVGDLEYSAEWRTDNGAHRLASLKVGPVRSTGGDADDAGTDDGLPPGEVSASLDRAIATLGESPPNELETAALSERFADADPEQRVRAALALEPEGDGLKALCDMLAKDPDPRVRAAATASLENSEDFAAVRALVDALADPNAEVVVEVIDSLEFAADASIVPDLEKLLAHDDPRVRQRAADAIDFFGE